MASYEIAQLNAGRAVAPLDDAVVADSREAAPSTG
jgi:hypothetical protein